MVFDRRGQTARNLAGDPQGVVQRRSCRIRKHAERSYQRGRPGAANRAKNRGMSAVLPTGYLSILEAADVLSRARHAGVPDSSLVIELRKGGLNVGDGPARDRSIAEIWKAVDGTTLRVMAIGGRPRRMVRLSPELTKGIPTLCRPRGRGFAFLRQSNPAYQQLASWFGPLLHEAVLAFRETEIQKLARKLMRARRIFQKTGGKERSRGRPSRIGNVQPVIKGLIDQQKWNPTMGLKALTREVNSTGKWPQRASQDTVARALNLLHDQTKDRRFERIRHQRSPRTKRSRISY